MTRALLTLCFLSIALPVGAQPAKSKGAPSVRVSSASIEGDVYLLNQAGEVKKGAAGVVGLVVPACYDVFANEDKIIDGQMGVAICTPVVSIPPRGVLVAFEKPFEDKKLGISFGRGCCWGMHPIPPKDFLDGVNKSRKIRHWPPVGDPMGDLSGPTAGKKKS